LLPGWNLVARAVVYFNRVCWSSGARAIRGLRYINRGVGCCHRRIAGRGRAARDGAERAEKRDGTDHYRHGPLSSSKRPRIGRWKSEKQREYLARPRHELIMLTEEVLDFLVSCLVEVHIP